MIDLEIVCPAVQCWLKNLALISIALFIYPDIQANSMIPPIDEITITSDEMSVRAKQDHIAIQYRHNVTITIKPLATITAKTLDIIMNNELAVSEQSKASMTDTFSKFKKIILTGNVHLISNNKSIYADSAELFMPSKKCRLKGNIKIEQTKVEHDIPFSTVSNEAILNLETFSCTFRGTPKTPVTTHLSLTA